MKNSGFLKYLQDKLNIQTDDLADFLFIDKRTLYKTIFPSMISIKN